MEYEDMVIAEERNVSSRWFLICVQCKWNFAKYSSWGNVNWRKQWQWKQQQITQKRGF